MFGAGIVTATGVDLAFFGGGLGTPEIIVILVVLLLLFGSRLPSVMRSLGRSATEFKKGMHEITDDNFQDEAKAPTTHAPGDDNHSEEPPAG
jgi:sec-independent protein translocase protein TatA